MRFTRLFISVVAVFLQTHITLAQDNLASPVAKRDVYQLINPGQVQFNGFLRERMDENREGRLKKYMTEKWLLNGFRNRPGMHPWIGEHVGKWLHAATLALEYKPDDKEFKDKIISIANGLMDCQMKDGYLGTYGNNNRWTSWDVWSHKYNLVGLLSYYQTTSDKRALDTCRRIGDLLISVFGDNNRDILKSGTHEGMAATSILEPMSLLYELTGEKKYLEFCQYVVTRADAGPKIMSNIENMHSVQAVGNKKAYEMLSNYVGLVEYWRATGYTRGLEAAKLAWDSIVKENLFITGAPDAHERFSEPGTLVPSGKCTETCVQVTWIQLNWQLLRATGNPRYATMLHHHYYNHMLAAQHQDGINWCYFTTMTGDKKAFTKARHCCGSSGPRAIALIPQMIYMTAKDALAVNIYETSTFKGDINGVSVTVQQNTDYPWDGDISMTIEVDRPVKFDLQLLVPGFVQSGEVVVSGSKITDIKAGTYFNIRREWSGKTPVKIRFDMPPVLHTRVYNEKKRYAISRGPVVLALEKIMAENIQPCEVIPELNSLDQAFSKGWAKRGTQNTVIIKGKKISPESKNSSGTIDLVFKPYCQAGMNHEVINIWLPAPIQKKDPIAKRKKYKTGVGGTGAKIALLPPWQDGPGFAYLKENNLMGKTRVITETELIDKKAFNAEKYPVAIYMAGERYVTTVKKKGDGAEAILNYLKQGGMIVFLPYEPWPMYHGLEDGEETEDQDIMFTKLKNLKVSLIGVEEPSESLKIEFNNEQNIIKGLPGNMKLPTDGDLRMRAIDPDSISENAELTPILSIEEYGDIMGYIEYTDGIYKGGKILYIWSRLLDQDYSDKILDKVFKFIDKKVE